MTIRAATPYLILSGKADQAIALYTRALQAKTEALMRFGDMDESCPVAQRNNVMHAALRIGNAQLMLSDGAGSAAPAPGGAVHVALDFEEPEEMHRCFDALAASGKVQEAILSAPWGLFGALEDEFGIQWMFNCTHRPA
jgi:PhnB protein